MPIAQPQVCSRSALSVDGVSDMVTLRHFAPEDAESVRSRLYPDMTLEQIREMIAEWNTGSYQGRYFEMFAVLAGGRIAGCVSLLGQSRSMASAGIEIFPEERKKGFASEAYALILKRASEKGYRLIMDQVRPDNLASVRLHEKLGFESDEKIYRNRKGHDVLIFVKPL